MQLEIHAGQRIFLLLLGIPNLTACQSAKISRVNTAWSLLQTSHQVIFSVEN